MGFDVKNKKCAVCEAYLFEDDDVVCCPICGAPHHRDCYSAVGHCGLEKYHGTDLQYKAEETEEVKNEKTETASGNKGRICTQCGKEYPSDARFCPYCGYSEMTGFFAEGNMRGFGGFNTVADDTDIGEGVTAKEAAGVVLINHFRYIYRFLSLNKTKKRSWNWAGFLLPGSWFAYRKMYKESIISVVFLIISTVLSFPLLFALEQLPTAGNQVNMMTYYAENLPSIGYLPLILAAIGGIINLLVRIISAMYGDWFYKKRVTLAAQEIKKAEKALDSDEAEAAKKKWSGVSFIGFMVAFFALEFVPTIIMMFI